LLDSNCLNTSPACSSPYTYIGKANMPLRINNVFNDAVDEYEAGDYAALVYIVLTDADDIGNQEELDSTLLKANQNNTPIHLIYIRGEALDPTDAKYIHYYQYYSGIQEKVKGVWFQGSVATIDDNLDSIISSIATVPPPVQEDNSESSF